MKPFKTQINGREVRITSMGQLRRLQSQREQLAKLREKDEATADDRYLARKEGE